MKISGLIKHLEGRLEELGDVEVNSILKTNDKDDVPDIRSIYTEKELRKGLKCPCCDKNFKVSRRKINLTMLQYLKAIYYEMNNKNDGWVKASRIRIHAKADSSGETDKKIQTGDYKRLSIWGLVEVRPNPTMVRITQKGIDFLQGITTVREAAWIENNKDKFIEFAGGDVNVYDVAGTSFNINEINES